MTTIITVLKKSDSCNRVKQNIFFKLKNFNFTMSKYFQSEHQHCISKIKEFIPKLTTDLSKGQCGKIGIIGGSTEYTGAPYFSAISALTLGADLVYVFCCKDAGPVIKSYSPELIVLPILDDPYGSKKMEPWLSRLHVLVVGPGLGREPSVLSNVANIIKHCSDISELPLVIDADGLYLITENISLIQKYKGPVILTPNQNEFNRLSAKLPNPEPLQVAESLNAVIVQKGLTDMITNGISHKHFNFNLKDVTIKCEISGSNRRCGGQGDILSGCIATLVAWFVLQKQKKSSENIIEDDKSYEEKLAWFRDNLMGFAWASYGGCVVTKASSRLAFEEHGRSMTASKMISYIHKAFKSYFE